MKKIFLLYLLLPDWGTWSLNLGIKISSSLNINSQFNLIEIGPGYGSLTNSLIKKKPAQILVIEKEYHLKNILHHNKFFLYGLLLFLVYKLDTRHAYDKTLISF